jgi:hypothetical protein
MFFDLQQFYTEGCPRGHDFLSIDLLWETVGFSKLNEKTMGHSDHWIMTGWHGEQ